MRRHPAVVFLQQALDRAEKVARATRQPSPHWDNFDMDGELRDRINAGTVAYIPHSADRAHIALHDPAAVLRRVSADRQILTEHRRMQQERPAFVLNEGSVPCCSTCWGDTWPCLTVRLLAAGWGWTEDAP